MSAFLQAADMVAQALKATQQSQVCSGITEGGYFDPKPATLGGEELQLVLVVESDGADLVVAGAQKVSVHQLYSVHSFYIHSFYIFNHSMCQRQHFRFLFNFPILILDSSPKYMCRMFSHQNKLRFAFMSEI